MSQASRRRSQPLGAWNRLMRIPNRRVLGLTVASAEQFSSWPADDGARSKPDAVTGAVVLRVAVCAALTALPGACARAEDATRQAATIRARRIRTLRAFSLVDDELSHMCLALPTARAKLMLGSGIRSHLGRPPRTDTQVGGADEMRHRLVLAALSCSALLPCSALADTYDFSFTELSALAAGPVQYDFKLDTDLASATPTGADFTGVVISKNNMDQPAGEILLQNLTNIASSEFFLVDTDTPTQDFYSGTGKGIQFNTGRSR